MQTIKCCVCGLEFKDFMEAGLHAKTKYWHVDVGLERVYSLVFLKDTINFMDYTLKEKIVLHFN